MELTELIEAFKAGGVQLHVAGPQHLTVNEAAARIGVGPDWVRSHKDEFPNVWRLPGAGSAGELRFPVGDVDAMAKRRRLKKQPTNA